jgi:hypothetical protein
MSADPHPFLSEWLSEDEQRDLGPLTAALWPLAGMMLRPVLRLPRTPLREEHAAAREALGALGAADLCRPAAAPGAARFVAELELPGGCGARARLGPPPGGAGRRGPPGGVGAEGEGGRGRAPEVVAAGVPAPARLEPFVWELWEAALGAQERLWAQVSPWRHSVTTEYPVPVVVEAQAEAAAWPSAAPAGEGGAGVGQERPPSPSGPRRERRGPRGASGASPEGGPPAPKAAAAAGRGRPRRLPQQLLLATTAAAELGRLAVTHEAAVCAAEVALEAETRAPPPQVGLARVRRRHLPQGRPAPPAPPQHHLPARDVMDTLSDLWVRQARGGERGADIGPAAVWLASLPPQPLASDYWCDHQRLLEQFSPAASAPAATTPGAQPPSAPAPAPAPPRQLPGPPSGLASLAPRRPPLPAPLVAPRLLRLRSHLRVAVTHPEALPGSVGPARVVYRFCKRWTFGAASPCAGLSVLLCVEGEGPGLLAAERALWEENRGRGFLRVEPADPAAFAHDAPRAPLLHAARMLGAVARLLRLGGAAAHTSAPPFGWMRLARETLPAARNLWTLGYLARALPPSLDADLALASAHIRAHISRARRPPSPPGPRREAASGGVVGPEGEGGSAPPKGPGARPQRARGPRGPCPQPQAKEPAAEPKGPGRVAGLLRGPFRAAARGGQGQGGGDGPRGCGSRRRGPGGPEGGSQPREAGSEAPAGGRIRPEGPSPAHTSFGLPFAPDLPLARMLAGKPLREEARAALSAWGPFFRARSPFLPAPEPVPGISSALPRAYKPPPPSPLVAFILRPKLALSMPRRRHPRSAAAGDEGAEVWATAEEPDEEEAQQPQAAGEGPPRGERSEPRRRPPLETVV